MICAEEGSYHEIRKPVLGIQGVVLQNDNRTIQSIGRIITFIIVALVLVQAWNLTRNVSAYEEMYKDLGSSVGSVASLFLNTPTWIYWVGTILICGAFIIKDNYVKKPIPRVLSNICAYLIVLLIAHTINSVITSGVYGLMKVIK